MSNQEELKHELNEELSQLVRSYEDDGLPPTEISDSLSLYSELAETRRNPVRKRNVVLSD